jgi:hypothetical protein
VQSELHNAHRSLTIIAHADTNRGDADSSDKPASSCHVSDQHNDSATRYQCQQDARNAGHEKPAKKHR